MEIPDDLVQEFAKILAYLEDYRERGVSASLVGPPAQVLVAGYDGVFLQEAHRSASRAAAAHAANDAPAEAGAAASAILCSIAACEAGVSEYVAQLELAEGKASDAILKIRRERDLGRQWRHLLKLKVPGYDLGSCKEYLHLGCLVKVRDLTAHRNARTAPVGGFPASLSDCVRQRVVPVRKAKDADWTSVIFVAEVAQWAALTADAWLALARALLPQPRMG